jgi:hypothetical protein
MHKCTGAQAGALTEEGTLSAVAWPQDLVDNTSLGDGTRLRGETEEQAGGECVIE